MGRRDRCTEDPAYRRADQRRPSPLCLAKKPERCSEALKEFSYALCSRDWAHCAFAETSYTGRCMKQAQFRAIPSVDKVLLSLGDTGLPRAMVVEVVRRELGTLRRQKTIPGFDAVIATIDTKLRDLR